MIPPTAPRFASAEQQHSPAWFRYVVVAIVTLILCSCQVADPSLPIAANNAPATPLQPTESATAAPQIQQASHTAEEQAAEQPVADAGVVNALYTEDTADVHEPTVRLAAQIVDAEVAAAQCPMCPPPSPGPCVCVPDCGGVGPPDEYLCDGGDYGLPVGVRADWTIDGLEQEDTVAHYDTVDGRVVVTPSNRVCIYAPRFGVVRRSIDLHEYARYEMPISNDSGLALARIDEDERAATSLNQLEPVINRAERPPSLMLERQQAGELALDIQVREFDGALAPYADLQVIRVGIIDNTEKALVAETIESAVAWTGDQAAQVTIDKKRAQAEVSVLHPGVVYHDNQPNNPKLRLIKCASTAAAQPGDEVEFTLRFDNIGDRVIGNVTIVDNLTTRLEYIDGTAEASVDAEFSANPNDHGSVVMRWEITEPVEPGEGGILKFKCRVR